MKRVLVIGATGTVGRAVVSQLAAANVRVRALTRHPHSAGLPVSIETVTGDLTNPATTFTVAEIMGTGDLTTALRIPSFHD